MGNQPRDGAILLVEDTADVRMGLVQLLKLHGFSVFGTPSGEEALSWLTATPEGYALVLLDLMLPGACDGRWLRRLQLADARLAAIPTIVVSVCEPEVAASAQLRPAAWLEKPCRFDVLLAAVKQYVRPW